MKRSLLCAVLVVGMTGPAMAAYLNGHQLLEKCQGEGTDQSICIGYVEGVADTLIWNTIDGFRACIPAGVTAQKAKDITVAWLKANPPKRRYNANTLVAAALSEALPCKKRP